MSGENNSRVVRIALLTIPILLISIALLQRRIDASSAPLQDEKPEMMLRSGTMLKKLSLGYDSLLADIYWTRAVQYYGVRAGKPGATFDLLAPLLDVTTTLDPKFMVAYRFGAIFLSEPPPAGPGRADLAVDLVKKGIAANPDEWRLYQDLGFLYFIYLKDYQKAADAYLEGSKNPNAQIYLKVLAATVAQKGDSMETSRLIWAEVYASSKDEMVRKRALEHVKALDASLDLKRLNEISEEYWKKFGHYPKTIQELRDVGLVGGSLTDPAGYPYMMGEYGVPQLDPKSPIVLHPDKKLSSQ
jgi:tetratricopeptide (TPR) repeat protein